MKFKAYYEKWIKKREKDFPVATVAGDRQRARDYLLPIIGNIELSKIDLSVCKKLFLKVMAPDFKPGTTLSQSSRDHIKALLSAILSAAVNEPDAEISFNPVREIKFSERRIGKKRPRILGGIDECLKFIEAAKDEGETSYAIVCTFLMSGLRKQELIALRWSSINFEFSFLNVLEKYEQASGKILPGTKAGENVIRTVPVPKDLIDILLAHQKSSNFKKPEDFVFTDESGHHLQGWDVSRIIERVRKRGGFDVSAHSLRHTYGRNFVANGGNIKVLQACLGHASSSTTDLYSQLAGKRIEGAGEIANVFKKEK